jgi:ABC-type sugar transport system ATPase subunit
MTNREASPLLILNGVSKSFPGVKALQDVNLSVFSGEIHALMGENGAGKSTLLKILFGAYVADQGSLELNGQTMTMRGPTDALRHGISMVHQELSLVPQLTAIQNIVLGREPSSAGFINWSATRKEALAALRKLDFIADPNIPVGRLSVAQQQVVELARALAGNAKIIILDEPTASLSSRESEKLFEILRELRREGHALVYVSHRLAEVFDLADRATVLRDGKMVGTVMRGPELTEKTLIQMMVGRGLANYTDAAKKSPGEPLLEVNGLVRNGVFNDISFKVRSGEIVGMAGMVGSGRTEVARCIVGADRLDAGTVTVKGSVLRLRSPSDSVKAGIAFLTEDRKHQGLALRMSLATNATLARLPARFGFIDRRKQRDDAQKSLARVSAKIPVTRLAGQLSGGNQQKVVIAKWLLSNSDIFIFDEPTRGIDVGAKAEIYSLMRELADNGAGILMITSEMPELLRMSDRILVMREGSLVGEMPRADASEERVVAYTSGGEQAWLN